MPCCMPIGSLLGRSSRFVEEVAEDLLRGDRVVPAEGPDRGVEPFAEALRKGGLDVAVVAIPWGCAPARLVSEFRLGAAS